MFSSEKHQDGRFRQLRFERVEHAHRRGRASVETLAEVSFTVEANEFVTIIGPSGCGKSTVFNLAAGLLEPTGGSVVLNDNPLRGVNPDAAYMFQRPALLDWRNVVDNIGLGQEFLGRDRKAARRAARESVADFGLAGFEERHPWELSGGMRQRVALLRTYLTQRDLLLLDEPFGALDALTRLQMQQFLLDRWEADQRTVAFITHDVDEAILLGDRVIVLSERPARVVREVAVPFSRPRLAEEVVTDPTFVTLKRELLEMLQPARALATANEAVS